MKCIQINQEKNYQKTLQNLYFSRKTKAYFPERGDGPTHSITMSKDGNT